MHTAKHHLAEEGGNRFALKSEDDEALNHLVDLFHELKAEVLDSAAPRLIDGLAHIDLIFHVKLLVVLVVDYV